MKKLALVVGSLLVVSAVASAKEVVPAPKQVAQEAPVKVVEKVVVKEVPVEKVVEKVVVKEVAAPKKWQPSGEFEVSHESGLYKYDFSKDMKTNENFWAFKKEGELEASAKVKFAPKHSVNAKTVVGLQVLPSYNANKFQKMDDASLKSFEVGYTYDYNQMAKLNLTGKVEKDDNSKVTKTIAVKPVFDVKEYFFKNDYVKAKSIAFTPAYSYSWKNEFDDTDNGMHNLSLGAKAKFALPADVELELDLSKFFIMTAHNVTADNKYYFIKHGKVSASLGKEFGLYENGNHSVDLGVKGAFETAYNFTVSDITNLSKINIDKNKQSVHFYNYNLKATAELTYNYKFNDYAKLYTTLSATYKHDADRQTKATTERTNTLTPKAKVGLKVTF